MGDNQTSASEPSNEKSWIGKVLPELIALVVGVVGGILATAFTGVGEDLRERITPTKSIVLGYVTEAGESWTNGTVMLDPPTVPATATTDSSGGFYFEGLRLGGHVIHITEQGNVLHERKFPIPKGVPEVELGTIEIAPNKVEQPPSVTGDVVLTPNPQASLSAVAPASLAASPAPGGQYNTWLTPVPVTVRQTAEAIELPPNWSVELLEPTLALYDEFPALRGQTRFTELRSVIVIAGPPATPVADTAGNPAALISLMHQELPIPESDHSARAHPNAKRFMVQVGGPLEALLEIDRVTYYLPELFNPSIVTRFSLDDRFQLAIDAEAAAIVARVFFRDGTSEDYAIEL